MKVLLCFAVAVAVVIAQTANLTEEQKANWKKWSEECKKETGVSSESIQKIRDNVFDFTDKDKVLAHGLCFAKKCGLAKPDGELDVDTIKAKLKRVVSSDEEVEKIIKKCVVKKSTNEETSFEAFKCIRETEPAFSPV